MRRGVILALVLLAAPAGRGAESVSVSGDLARLQGRWDAAVAGGKASVSLTIKGHTVTAKFVTKLGLKIQADGELKIDETTSPKSVDWVKFTTNDGQEIPEVQGIYRLEDGRFVLRSGGFNDVRPAEFKDGPGMWDGVIVFDHKTGDKS